MCRMDGDGGNACRMGSWDKSLSEKGKAVLFTDLSTENGDKTVRHGKSGCRVQVVLSQGVIFFRIFV